MPRVTAPVARFLAPLVAGLLLAVPVSAQTSTWTGGAGNGDWNAPANWGGTLPPSGSGTAIVLGGNTHTGSVAVNRGTLTLGNQGTIATSGALFVGQSGTLVLDNTLATNLNRLSNTVPMTLGGGSVLLFGQDTQASTEATGALTLA